MTPTSPPRPELVALLDAVKDHSDDDTPRLVLADWLDEQGNELDAERAAFVRADIDACRGRGLRPTLSTEAERAAEAERFKRWLGPVAEFATGGFHRGLPTVWLTGPNSWQPRHSRSSNTCAWTTPAGRGWRRWPRCRSSASSRG
jgi:uncharacterized protein (TIGR02996 family)